MPFREKTAMERGISFGVRQEERAPLIKIVSGVRWCGKSALLGHFIRRLLKMTTSQKY